VKEALTRIPDELFAFMQQPQLTQITTLDHESKGPFANVISWVLAYTPEAVRLVGDSRTRFMQNLRADGRVALTVLGAGTAWTLYGNARVLAERTPGISLPLTLVELTDLQIYEVMFWGAVLSRAPEWDVTYSREASDKLDAEVVAAMRSFAS
jgi:hypothetical protein